MPLYMIQFSYTTEAWTALTKKPTDRRAAIRAIAEKSGGRLIELYYAFGEYDGIVLMEAPDDTTAAAIILAAVSPGHLKANKTTKLLSVEDTLEALRKASTLAYSAPSANG